MLGDQTMAYEIAYPWHRNPRLIKLTFGEQLTSTEIAEALEAVATLYDQAMLPMQLVIDFSYVQSGPENILDVFRSSRMIRHEKQGYCMFVNPDKFLRFMGQVLYHEAGLHVEFRPTDADAWDFFSEMGFC